MCLDSAAIKIAQMMEIKMIRASEFFAAANRQAGKSDSNAAHKAKTIFRVRTLPDGCKLITPEVFQQTRRRASAA